MEARQLKRNVEALIGDYIGQKLREKSFDPKGREISILDDLAHYDLAISVALWWLDREEGRDVLDRDIIGATSSSGSAQYPNRLEREAMILSSFAGIIMNSLPVEEILALYRCKPAASYPNHQSKTAIVYPFTLSYHPFAMLGSYKAVYHSKKHNLKLKRWLSERTKSNAPPGRVSVQSSSSSSSSHSFLSQ
ncbi:uncharacterized protein C2orf80 isoform X2 [Larimichthys crocea]|uniref:uncharacterized protein C2orf80 isoform X2 n=1 Tax=Larimichthys crocea TaxID=215358 RepID=UPI000F5FCA25|nr:uncharacterized protein C2orf80 homolog isoform X2 [Larimichthys crocea]